MTASSGRVPRGVVVLGLVSLCMDVSSELVHAVLPLFLATGLGASMFAIGLIEGAAEAIALIVKVFSGVLSDTMQRRKPLVLMGYGLAAFTKPLFALAPTLGWVVTARFADRVGKGIRGAPRDALIADITPPDVRGASFGLRQSLDTVGAIIGPVAAIAAMAMFANDFRVVFWIAVIPAFAAVALIVFGVEEPDRPRDVSKPKRLVLADARRLPAAYWVVTGIAALMALSRFSEAFLVLRAADVGLSLGHAPWVMVVMTIVYAAVAYPAGAALDRGRGMAMLHGGLVALVAAHLLLMMATGTLVLLAGAAMWGLHMGLTQGIFAAMVAEHAPADLRGSAFGVFNLASGVAMLIGSGTAGALWDVAGARATFATGAAIAGVTVLALVAARRTLESRWIR